MLCPTAQVDDEFTPIYEIVHLIKGGVAHGSDKEE